MTIQELRDRFARTRRQHRQDRRLRAACLNFLTALNGMGDAAWSAADSVRAFNQALQVFIAEAEGNLDHLQRTVYDRLRAEGVLPLDALAQVETQLGPIRRS